MKPYILGLGLAAVLALPPLAHADTVPIGDPYTDTIQLWSEIASALSSLANDFASLFNRQEFAVAPPATPPAALAAAAADAAPAQPPTRQDITYTVQAGDTLSGIAQTFTVPLSNILAANNLSQGAILHPGETLIIPDPQTAPATSSEPTPSATSDQTTLSQNVKSADSASTNPAESVLTTPTPAFNAGDFVTQSELAQVLFALSTSPSTKSAPTTAPAVPLADGNPLIPYAAENNITNLSNVTISNANLSASEIPALNYFPATSTVSVGYGGTGTSNAPTYGQLLLGNGNGGYTLTATSSLGILSGSSLLLSANTWSALNLFSGGASTTNFSNFGTAYFGGTATSSFNGAGALSLVSNGLTVGTNQLIVSGGNVGIGTTSPSATFAVNGGGYLSGNLAALGFSTNKVINYSGTASALNNPFYWSGSATGTCSGNSTNCALDTLLVNGDSDVATTSGAITAALAINHNFGGGQGGFDGIDSIINMTAATQNTGDSGYYVADDSTAQATANDTGTSGAYSGHLYGIGTNVRLTGGATYWDQLVGQENDVAAYAGSSLNDKIGLQIVETSLDAVQANDSDIGLSLNNGTGATGWKIGIGFGARSGYNPVSSGGTLIGTYAHGGTGLGVGSMGTVANGIDFSNYIFTGDFLKSVGFTVDGSGNASSSAISGNQAWFGSTATSSFASNGALTTVGILSAGQDASDNGIQIVPGSTSGNNPAYIAPLLASGQSNVALQLRANGTGAVQLANSAGGTALSVSQDGTQSSSVDRLEVHGLASGSNAVYTQAAGPDSQINWRLITKGTGSQFLFGAGGDNPNSGNSDFEIDGGSTATSWLTANGSAAGSPALGCHGTNCNIILSPNGSGNVGLGTTSPWAEFSVNGLANGSAPIFAVATSSASYATTTALEVDQLGNVWLPNSYQHLGIGTTNVGSLGNAELTVANANGNAAEFIIGGGAVSGSAQADGFMDVIGYTGAAQVKGVLDASSGSLVKVGAVTNHPLQFLVNNSSVGEFSTSGNLGIGTTTPYARLSVWGPDTASSTLAFNVVNSASTTVFSVFDGGNAELSGSLSQSSDQRLKTNIQSLDASSSLSAIDELDPVTFNWIDPEKGTTPQLGFIAQQVQQIFPNLVSTTSATALTPDGTLSLNYIGLISPIVSAIQEISAAIASIENTIAGFATIFHTQELCVGSTCVTPTQFQAMVAAASASQSSGEGSGGSSSDDAQATDTPPIIQINGSNPAIIQVGTTYNDLGATITGPTADLNLGIQTFVNGAAMSPVQIDTSQAATDTIDYIATDQNGLTSTSTRTVIIEAPSIAPSDDASSTDAATTATSTAQ